MKVHFAPLAASMSVRIALDEASWPAEFVEVELATRRLRSGGDYCEVHPLGAVPVVELDDGSQLTETSAILQEIARQRPDAGLAPTDPMGVRALQSWLAFVSAELHRGVFGILVDRRATPGAKEYALGRAAERLPYLAAHLEGREFLLERFSVADAYLVTILGTSVATPIALSDYPPIAVYAARLGARPSVQRAFSLERKLYAEAAARNRATPETKTA